MEHTKHTKITNETRDAMARLSLLGLKNAEIADLLNVSASSVAYTMQCYKAAEMDDWKTLHRLSSNNGPNVRWALDKFGKTLPEKSMPEQGRDSCQHDSAPVEGISSEQANEILKSLNGIGFILSEILAELRG